MHSSDFIHGDWWLFAKRSAGIFTEHARQSLVLVFMGGQRVLLFVGIEAIGSGCNIWSISVNEDPCVWHLKQLTTVLVIPGRWVAPLKHSDGRVCGRWLTDDCDGNASWSWTVAGSWNVTVVGLHVTELDEAVSSSCWYFSRAPRTIVMDSAWQRLTSVMLR